MHEKGPTCIHIWEFCMHVRSLLTYFTYTYTHICTSKYTYTFTHTLVCQREGGYACRGTAGNVNRDVYTQKETYS